LTIFFREIENEESQKRLYRSEISFLRCRKNVFATRFPDGCFPKWALSACETGFIAVRNGAYQGAKWALSDAEMGFIANPSVRYDFPLLRKPLIDKQLRKVLKTRVFAAGCAFVCKYSILVKLTMNKYSSPVRVLYIYAIPGSVLSVRVRGCA